MSAPPNIVSTPSSRRSVPTTSATVIEGPASFLRTLILISYLGIWMWLYQHDWAAPKREEKHTTEEKEEGRGRAFSPPLLENQRQLPHETREKHKDHI